MWQAIRSETNVGVGIEETQLSHGSQVYQSERRLGKLQNFELAR
jgi:hypothetical protein